MTIIIGAGVVVTGDLTSDPFVYIDSGDYTTLTGMTFVDC